MEKTGKKKFGFLIKCLYGAHREYVDNLLKQYDLTMAQFSVLIEVLKAEDHNIELSQRDLERKLQVSNPTMTGIVNRLEGKGLVQRVFCSSDKRIRHIHSTPKARAMDEKLKKMFEQFDRYMVADFTKQEEEQFLTYLERAYHNIKNKEGNHD